MHRLTESDSGRELSVAVGDAIEIALPENPGTGYRWIVKAGREPCLSLESERFERGAAVPGRGGVHRWTFTAWSWIVKLRAGGTFFSHGAAAPFSVSR